MNKPAKNPVNALRHFVDERGLESAEIDSIQFVRDAEGVWRFADSWIPVPGARDVTLTERFKPKFIVSSDEVVERVVVSGESIEEAPALLDWCVELGTAITAEDGELIEVFVPYEDWQEHNRIPGALVAPEFDGTPAEQELAAVERQYREAESSFEMAAGMRAHALRRHADEITRQRAREITGLSVGRVQQLIRGGSITLPERRILELFEGSVIPTMDELQDLADEAGLPRTLDVLGPMVRELETRGLLEEVDDGMALSAEGATALGDARAAVLNAEDEKS